MLCLIGVNGPGIIKSVADSVVNAVFNTFKEAEIERWPFAAGSVRAPGVHGAKPRENGR